MLLSVVKIGLKTYGTSYMEQTSYLQCFQWQLIRAEI